MPRSSSCWASCSNTWMQTCNDPPELAAFTAFSLLVLAHRAILGSNKDSADAASVHQPYLTCFCLVTLQKLFLSVVISSLSLIPCLMWTNRRCWIPWCRNSNFFPKLGCCFSFQKHSKIGKKLKPWETDQNLAGITVSRQQNYAANAWEAAIAGDPKRLQPGNKQSSIRCVWLISPPQTFQTAWEKMRNTRKPVAQSSNSKKKEQNSKWTFIELKIGMVI